MTVDELNADVGWTNDAPPGPEHAPLRRCSHEELEEWWRVRVQKLAPKPKPMPNVQSEMFPPKTMSYEEAREKSREAREKSNTGSPTAPASRGTGGPVRCP
jgi:hypothetical protein